MFSEALIQMDKNTVKFMIEEQKKELGEQKKELEKQRKEMEEKKKVIESQAARIAELEAMLKNSHK